MKQRYLKNFTGQKLLVIFMVICSSLINGKAISQTTYYVNDNNSTGDIFCSAVGSNSNSGTASAPFVTISYAINAAADGDLIYIDAGSYSENVTVNKRLTITGAGSSTSGTIVTTASSGSVFIITSSGSNSTNRLIIKDIRVTGASESGISVTNSIAAGYFTFDNVTSLSNNYGISFAGTASVTDAIITNSTLSNNNNNGLRIASECPSFTGLTVSGCTISSNAWQAFSFNPLGSNVIGTDFNFSNCTFSGNCSSNANSSGLHDLSFFGFKGNATLSNVTIISNHSANGHGITFTAQGLGFQPAGTISLSNVSITGTVAKGAITFQYYNDLSNVSMNNVDVSGCTAPWGQMVIQDAGTGTFNIGNTTLKTMALWSTGNVNATSAIFKNNTSGAVLNRSSLADCYTIENQVNHATDAAGLGLIRVVANNLYVTTTSGSIQRGINAAAAGDAINVDAATFTGAVSLNKAVILRGANYGIAASGTRSSESIISNSGSTAINITAEGASVNGFTISGATAVSSTNVAATVSNNIISASAMGISIGGTSTGYAVSNNAVTLSAQVAGSNPTVGISITGVSGTSAATISNNNISGAFYGYYIYSVNSSTASSVSGGTITGCANGIAAINGYNGVYAFVPSNVNISNITMSGFTGGNPQAGIYCFSGGSSNSATMTLNISGVNISGTDKSTADAAAMNFSDFSTASSNLQNITVTNCTISNNKNRGINLRGSHATASITANTISNNGYDAFVENSIVGYGVIALEGATLNLSNNFITNPSSTTGAVPAYALCAAMIPTAQSLQPTVNATENKFDNNGLTNGGLITSNGIINADCNWWSSTSQTAIAAKFQNSGTLDYTPWLTSGNDADGSAAGFQPVSGSCSGAPLSLTESHVNVICSGATTGSIDLTVSGGTSPFSYAWTKSGDVSYSASTQDLSNLASGTYTVVVTDANSITATTSIEITSGTVVYPVITNQPTKVGRKVALNLPAEPYTITVAANSALTYQWYSNTTASNSGGVLIAGATSNSYTPPTSTSYTAYFYCVVSNENSCSRASDVSEVFIVCN